METNLTPEEKMKIEETTELTIMVRKWTIKDKYPCPQCLKKVGYPDYLCTKCNIKLKPKIQF